MSWLQGRYLSLNHFEDMGAAASYVGFLVQKEVGSSHLKNVVSCWMKVLVFLDTTGRCTKPHAADKLAWLCNLKSQVSRLVFKPTKDTAELKAEGEWWLGVCVCLGGTWLSSCW